MLAAIVGIWFLYFLKIPIVGLLTAIGFSIAIISIKRYDDKSMGITAYGERKDKVVIAESYLKISDVRIP